LIGKDERERKEKKFLANQRLLGPTSCHKYFSTNLEEEFQIVALLGTHRFWLCLV